MLGQQHQYQQQPHYSDRYRQPIGEYPYEYPSTHDEDPYRVAARRSSQPCYNPDNRGRLSSHLNVEPQDQDYKDPKIKNLVSSADPMYSLSITGSTMATTTTTTVAAPRRGSGGSSSSSSSRTAITATAAFNSGGTIAQQLSSTGSSTSSAHRNGSIGNGSKREITTSGGMVTLSTQRTDNTGSRTQFHAPLEPEVVAKLDDIFFKFLQRICSDW
ncbi:hypothetical protein EDD11_002386 [Mortierella claussenii]|nr:hypothetical protein EDD11_002386 [Mortierella claussenii]